MDKEWGPSTTDAEYTGKRSHSTAPGPYGWPPASKPNAACRVPSSACELRWTLEMVAIPEVVVVHLLLATIVGPTRTGVPALACSTSQ